MKHRPSGHSAATRVPFRSTSARQRQNQPDFASCLRSFYCGCPFDSCQAVRDSLKSALHLGVFLCTLCCDTFISSTIISLLRLKNCQEAASRPLEPSHTAFWDKPDHTVRQMASSQLLGPCPTDPCVRGPALGSLQQVGQQPHNISSLCYASDSVRHACRCRKHACIDVPERSAGEQVMCEQQTAQEQVTLSLVTTGSCLS